MAAKLTLSAGFLVKPNGLTFFSRNLETLVELPLSSQIMSDLEITSQASLERVLANWLEQIKVPPGPICLLLDSSVYFDTTLKQLPADDTDPAVLEFLDEVPFNDTLLKYFSLPNGVAALAVNQGFLQPLINGLEKVGYIVVCVAPVSVLGIDLKKTPLTKEIGLDAVANLEVLNRYNFLTQAEVDAKIAPPHPFLTVEINARLVTMVTVFLVLIGVLAGVVFLQTN